MCTGVVRGQTAVDQDAPVLTPKDSIITSLDKNKFLFYPKDKFEGGVNGFPRSYLFWLFMRQG